MQVSKEQATELSRNAGRRLLEECGAENNQEAAVILGELLASTFMEFASVAGGDKAVAAVSSLVALISVLGVPRDAVEWEKPQRQEPASDV